MISQGGGICRGLVEDAGCKTEVVTEEENGESDREEKTTSAPRLMFENASASDASAAKLTFVFSEICSTKRATSTKAYEPLRDTMIVVLVFSYAWQNANLRSKTVDEIEEDSSMLVKSLSCI